MNYFVLEGIPLYVFLAAIVLLLTVLLLCVVISILVDRQNFMLINLLMGEKRKVKNLVKENFVLKIKCGEFSIDDEEM